MNCCVKRESEEETCENAKSIDLKSKIPRPPNAFMLYANENRKIMAQQFPADSNKEISKKLGSSWKNLDIIEKNKYFDRARVIDMEHKRKYPNYVYNPKEARIRKAMREATRDRSIGASPMLPRPSARRAASHGWVAVHEEQLMMPNPLASLQHQTEMWHNFHDDMRPRSGNPYMMQEVSPPFQHQPSPPLSIPSPMMIDKHRHTPHTLQPVNNTSMPVTPPLSNISMTPPHSNENVPPDEALLHSQQPTTEESFESKHMIDAVQPLMENNNLQQQNESFISVYGQNVPNQPQFEKTENVRVKKIQLSPNTTNTSCNNVLHLPLSCTNFCASPDLFTNNIEYQREYITKYFQSCPDYDVFNFMTEDENSFPYATISNVLDNTFLCDEFPQPNFIQTDIGYIPIMLDETRNLLKFSGYKVSTPRK